MAEDEKILETRMIEPDYKKEEEDEDEKAFEIFPILTWYEAQAKIANESGGEIHDYNQEDQISITVYPNPPGSLTTRVRVEVLTSWFDSDQIKEIVAAMLNIPEDHLLNWKLESRLFQARPSHPMRIDLEALIVADSRFKFQPAVNNCVFCLEQGWRVYNNGTISFSKLLSNDEVRETLDTHQLPQLLRVHDCN